MLGKSPRSKGDIRVKLNQSQKVTYLFCDWLNIDLKVLIDRVRQATRDVVKSEV